VSDIQVTSVDGQTINVSTGTVVGPLPELQIAAGTGISINSSGGVSTISANVAELSIPVNLSDLSDVSNVSPTVGQTLSWNGTVWAADDDVANIADLADVSNVSPTVGQTLSWNGTVWAAADDVSNLSDLSDVSNVSPTVGQTLSWNGTAWVAANTTAGTTVNTLSGNISLVGGTNINISSDGQNLTIGTIGQASIANVTDLLDVNTTMSPANGQALVWNGSAWTADSVTALVSNGTTLDLGTGKILYSNIYNTLTDLPDAASYHGMFAHVHNYDGLGTGAAYYAHAGQWVRLADSDSIPTSIVNSVNGLSGLVTLAGGNNVQITQVGSALTISSTQTFSTLNGESGSLSLVGGQGISVSTVDNAITVSATNQGGISWANPPSDPGDPGDPGDMAYDDNYLYVHTSQGWRRSALGSWNPEITVTIQPQNLSVGIGGSGNFTVAATVSDGSSPSYQWQDSSDSGVTWDTITGANTTSYALSGVPASQNGTLYRAIVSAPGALNVTSNIATLTVSDSYDLLSETGDVITTESGSQLNQDYIVTTYDYSWSLVHSAINGTVASAELGSAVALDYNATTLVLGEPGSNTTRVFSNNGSVWSEATNSSIMSTGNDRFGFAVSVSDTGDKFVALGRQTGSGIPSGLRLFTNSNGTWSRVNSPVSFYWSSEPSADRGDAAISRDGSTVVVGVPFAGGTPGTNYQAAVTAFDISSGSFSQIGGNVAVSNVGSGTWVYYGNKVAVNGDGTVAAVSLQGSAIGRDSFYAVEVKEWTGSAWSPRGTTIEPAASGGLFGYDISLSSDGTRLAVGSPQDDTAGTDTGYARVYSWSGSAWSQLGADITGSTNYDYAGWSVSLSADGSRLAVGIRGSDPNGSNSGTTRIYEWSGSFWVQVGDDIPGEATGDYSGSSVQLSGSGAVVAIGSPGSSASNSSAGRGRVFEELVAMP